MKIKIRKGDVVEVVTGRQEDKGKRGEVIKVEPKGHRIVIQGVNLRKKHQSQVQTQGRTMSPGIIEFEGSIDISNVMLVCPKCDEPSRIGIQRQQGETRRVCKKCDALFE
ncbi:MAG: 50S ribosomal protein L24 [Anaerolineales bacterium]|nr:50S ribosomal protein L24 [Anaerolineales bacterium]